MKRLGLFLITAGLVLLLFALLGCREITQDVDQYLEPSIATFQNGRVARFYSIRLGNGKAAFPAHIAMRGELSGLRVGGRDVSASAKIFRDHDLVIVSGVPGGGIPIASQLTDGEPAWIVGHPVIDGESPSERPVARVGVIASRHMAPVNEPDKPQFFMLVALVVFFSDSGSPIVVRRDGAWALAGMVTMIYTQQILTSPFSSNIFPTGLAGVLKATAIAEAAGLRLSQEKAQLD